jgi:ABC-2 type transport system ATP-binding protein
VAADQIRAKTGALLEHSGIYEQMTAYDNLEFYGRVFGIPEIDRRSRIEELLRHMGLWERRKDRAGSWSRGMKQKLALARTLLHNPRLVLLDEPTAGLDVASAIAFREDLEKLVTQKKVTIFLTSHNMADVEKLCSLVAIIRDGRVVAQGNPEDLRKNLGKYRLKIIGRNFDDLVLQGLYEHPEVDELSRNNGQLTIELKQDCDTSALVGYLVDRGTHIDEVHREKASMEEVFIAYTGEDDGN